MSANLEKAKTELINTLLRDPSPDQSMNSIYRTIASKHRISPEALKSVARRFKKNGGRANSNNLFSVELEARLVGYMYALETLGNPGTKREV